MDPFDPLFTLADDGPADPTSISTTTSATTTSTTSCSAQQDLMDIFGGGDFMASSAPPLIPTSEKDVADMDPVKKADVEGDDSGGGCGDGGGGGDVAADGGGDVAVDVGLGGVVADGGGDVNGMAKTDPLEDLFGMSPPQPAPRTKAKTDKIAASNNKDDDFFVDLGHATQEAEETTSETDTWDLLDDMDEGETQGGPTVTLDDFLGISPPPSANTTTNGTAENTSSETLTIDDFFSSGTNGDGGHKVDKENSPEIVVNPADEENVALKDATSEKSLLGNVGDEAGGEQLTNGDSSETEEEKRISCSDMDLDFAVLEMDSSHLNLDLSKQKTSLRKRGSLARRKKPTRGSMVNICPDTTDSIFQDTTAEPKEVSPSTETAPEDEVFDQHMAAPEEKPPEKLEEERFPVRKSAMPFKPPMMMPGLQDLSQSKLFNQERKRSTEVPTSPVKSSNTSPTSPSRGAPPLVLPKPATKVQKDSQNLKVAAEKSPSLFSTDRRSISPSRDTIVDAVSVDSQMKQAGRTSSSSSSLGEIKVGRGDSLSSHGGPKPRTESWSSISSSVKLSRGDSMSSVEGEGSTTTPRRGSIQGSAYAPIGFRPRRTSSSVLDSSGKLTDSPTVTTPISPSLVKGEKSDFSAPLSPTGTPVKSPFPQSAWLSEMKDSNLSSRLRNASGGSADSAVDSSATSSREGSEVTGDVDRGTTLSSGGIAGVSLQSMSKELSPKRPQEQKPGKPSWMKAALEKTSRVADRLQAKSEQDNSSDDKDWQPVAPWAVELKKTNHPLVPQKNVEDKDGESSKGPTSPTRSNSNKENSKPIIVSSKDVYVPSWLRKGQQQKTSPVPAGSTPSSTANGSVTSPKTSPGNPMKAYETPMWKLELAEKKKQRESRTMPVDASDESPPVEAPQWRQQLSQRKKRPSPVKENEKKSSTGPEWAKQAEERRARLMKSGLFDAQTPTQ